MILTVLVGSAMSVVGTDEVTETVPFTVEDGAYALVLDEAIVPYTGTSVTVEATGADGKELFIGSANGVDTSSFLNGVAQVQIQNVSFPGEPEHRFVPGEAAPAAAAADRDWWTSQDTGPTVSRTFELDTDPQVLVVAPATEGESLDGTTVTMNMRVEGVLAWCLVGIALAVILFGFAAFFVLRWWNGRIRPKKKGQGENTEGSVQKPKTPEAPRRRDARNKRSLRIGSAIALGTGLALSGCGVIPIAQPKTPTITPYERTAVRPGEAGKYMTGYTEALDKILGEGGNGLETIQGAPIIERTRAQIQIAKRAKQNLSAPNFNEVVAGGPSFEAYPMWFYAFGTTEGEEKLTQVQLVTRESAASSPIVRTASYIPADQMPTLLADGTGAVETAPKEFTDRMAGSAEQASAFLADGTLEGTDLGGLEEAGFKSFRDYLGELRGEESGFDKVDVACKPYTDLDFAAMTLSTEGGAVGMGEIRCTITIKVPQDYALDLGDTVEAVKTNDKDGDTVQVDTAHPYVLVSTGDTLKAVTTDWDVLSSRIE